MKIKIEYSDIDSITREEAIDRVKHALGKSVSIEVHPESNAVVDILRFALSQMISYEQVCLFNDEPDQYAEKVKTLRNEVLARVLVELNSVILANECKFTE